jgi:hypothetical protein
MSTTGLEVLDTTAHRTNRWLNDVMEALGTDDRHQAYLALRAALHALPTGSRWRRSRISAPSFPC